MVSETTKKFIEYAMENKDAFNANEKATIISNIDNVDKIDKRDILPNILLQIYDELGILPDYMNPYKAFSELISSIYDIRDMNIVEIGGGTIPRLAKRLADMQTRGTVTVYDPNLYLKNSYPNIKLIKRNFYPITNVDRKDLLVGLLPCGASSTIVRSAIKNNKDFMIALCDSCNFYEYFDGYELDENWPYSFIEKASSMVEENNLGKLKVKHIKEIGLRYPIIYNDRG